MPGALVPSLGTETQTGDRDWFTKGIPNPEICRVYCQVDKLPLLPCNGLEEGNDRSTGKGEPLTHSWEVTSTPLKSANKDIHNNSNNHHPSPRACTMSTMDKFYNKVCNMSLITSHQSRSAADLNIYSNFSNVTCKAVLEKLMRWGGEGRGVVHFCGKKKSPPYKITFQYH